MSVRFQKKLVSKSICLSFFKWKNFKRLWWWFTDRYGHDWPQKTFDTKNCDIFLRKLSVLVFMHKNIFACLFNVLNTIRLSRHEQVCLIRPRFKRYCSHSLIKHTFSLSGKLFVLLLVFLIILLIVSILSI